jgi:hypothetical protein
MNSEFESAESNEIALNHSSPKYSRQITNPAIRVLENSSGYSSNEPNYSPLQNSDNIPGMSQENLYDYCNWLNSYNPFDEDSFAKLNDYYIDENIFLSDSSQIFE